MPTHGFPPFAAAQGGLHRWCWQPRWGKPAYTDERTICMSCRSIFLAGPKGEAVRILSPHRVCAVRYSRASFLLGSKFDVNCAGRSNFKIDLVSKFQIGKHCCLFMKTDHAIFVALAGRFLFRATFPRVLSSYHRGYADLRRGLTQRRDFLRT